MSAIIGSCAYRTPITFDGCFGWLHTRGANAASDVAILVCAALSREASISHHFFSQLADQLAAAGYLTLRFDYPGTGDSHDLPGPGFEGADCWTAWLESVHAAADFLQHRTSARQLVFCGLRIGATLATLAAQARDDTVGLALLAPVIRGRSYVRQLRVQARLQHRLGNTADGSLEVEELHFPSKALHAIEHVDLQQAKLPAGCRVAIFAESSSRSVAACADVWRQRQIAVERHGFAGLEPMVQYKFEEQTLSVDFSGLVSWVRRAIPSGLAPCWHDLPTGLASIQRPGYVEEPLTFQDRQRFGVLCRPDYASADLVVLICNSGRHPHYGAARFGVELARELAVKGIASLRMDFAGLGDSVGAADHETMLSPLFEVDRTSDISPAIDALRSRGFRRFAVQGISAGAYHAFHGSLADTRIDTLLLVNLPAFLWRTGDSIQDATPFVHLLSKLRYKKTWIQALRGRSAVKPILHAQYKRMLARIIDAERYPARLFRRGNRQTFGREAMATLSRRGSRTLFLFGPDEVGVELAEREFGPDGGGLAAFRRLPR